ncbi:hypothetical protein OS493_026062 [Desmophyllum pertusum]|uniref:Uncharacterized protein n=1 Tax=Desmophyllum pertusum TaxID=174260 RepID=A0A9X0CD84_9CNID|nr:hypothetical protein OS493_026062 [Desmophyllum pertusum]
MDTLWSSSSTFSINTDNRDDEDDETAGNNEVFVGGSEPNLLEGPLEGRHLIRSRLCQGSTWEDGGHIT